MSIAELTSKSIDIDHVGAIESLRIPIPEGGGVVVLRGANGAGKSTAIQSIQALTDKEQRKTLAPTDGHRSGEIEGLGVTVKIGRQNRSSGELECDVLDGSCDPSVLVDPGYKDPDVADRHRLASLIRLAGVKITPDKWAEFLGKETQELIDIGSLASSDPVEAADRIRRRLHELALNEEKLATGWETEAAAIEKSIGDVDLDAYVDPQIARDAHTVAVGELHALAQKRIDATNSESRRQQAESKIRELTAVSIDLVAQRNQLSKTEQKLQESNEKLTRLRDEVAQASAENNVLRTQLLSEQEKLNTALTQSKSIEQLREIINSNQVKAPTDGELMAAQAAANHCQAAIQRAEVIRRAREQSAKASDLRAKAKHSHHRADKIRDKARTTDQVLEQSIEQVGVGVLRVVDGRLACSTDRSKAEPFSELSHGERWKLALDVAATRLGTGGVFSVRQEAWEGLDPDNRAAISRMAQSRGIVLITAEATSGNLTAEVFA